MSVNSKMTAISDAIRFYTGNTSKLTLDDMASEISEVYIKGEDDGWTAGLQVGFDDGLEEGRKSEYDRFWDAYQNNGSRVNYFFGFAGDGWNNTTFKPKHDIKPTQAYAMFRQSKYSGDLAALLEGQGVVLDFSNCTESDFLFHTSAFTRIGVVDLSKTNSLNYTFQNSKIATIDKLIIKSGGNQNFTYVFHSCADLVNLDIEGVIGRNGCDLQWSTKLSKASITSVINALSSTTSGLTVTLSKTAKEAAFTAEEWATLIATKSNWTISLV